MNKLIISIIIVVGNIIAFNVNAASIINNDSRFINPSCDTNLSLTVSSTDVMAFTIAWGNNNDVVTAVNWNGDAMTQIANLSLTNRRMYAYVLKSPDSGTHDLFVDCTGGAGGMGGHVMQLSNVDLTGDGYAQVYTDMKGSGLSAAISMTASNGDYGMITAYAAGSDMIATVDQNRIIYLNYDQDFRDSGSTYSAGTYVYSYIENEWPTNKGVIGIRFNQEGEPPAPPTDYGHVYEDTTGGNAGFGESVASAATSVIQSANLSVSSTAEGRFLLAIVTSKVKPNEAFWSVGGVDYFMEYYGKIVEETDMPATYVYYMYNPLGGTGGVKIVFPVETYYPQLITRKYWNVQQSGFPSVQTAKFIRNNLGTNLSVVNPNGNGSAFAFSYSRIDEDIQAGYGRVSYNGNWDNSDGAGWEQATGSYDYQARNTADYPNCSGDDWNEYQVLYELVQDGELLGYSTTGTETFTASSNSYVINACQTVWVYYLYPMNFQISNITLLTPYNNSLYNTYETVEWNLQYERMNEWTVIETHWKNNALDVVDNSVWISPTTSVTTTILTVTSSKVFQSGECWYGYAIYKTLGGRYIGETNKNFVCFNEEANEQTSTSSKIDWNYCGYLPDFIVSQNGCASTKIYDTGKNIVDGSIGKVWETTYDLFGDTEDLLGFSTTSANEFGENIATTIRYVVNGTQFVVKFWGSNSYVGIVFISSIVILIIVEIIRVVMWSINLINKIRPK